MKQSREGKKEDLIINCKKKEYSVLNKTTQLACYLSEASKSKSFGNLNIWII